MPRTPELRSRLDVPVEVEKEAGVGWGGRMARKVALGHGLCTRVSSGEFEQQEAPEPADPTKHGKIP